MLGKSMYQIIKRAITVPIDTPSQLIMDAAKDFALKELHDPDLLVDMLFIDKMEFQGQPCERYDVFVYLPLHQMRV